MQTITEIMEKMIDFSEGNLHDIDHFMRVWNYARTIGALEGLDPDKQFVLEVAAIVHDIACPLCREKYGSTNGKYQELEGALLAVAFLADSGMPADWIARVTWLVGHHHTLNDVEGIDWQILIEADYIANAAENGWSAGNIANFAENMCKTAAGRSLIKAVFGV